MMRLRFLGMVLLWLPLTALTEDLSEAVSAMRRGDYAEAYCLMRPLADSGDAYAQYNIGWMYLNGYGLRVDELRALDWWQKAAAQGHADASFSLGMLYSSGEGDVPRDTDLAIDYYLRAAQAGHEDAAAMLRSMLLHNDPAIIPRMHEIMSQHAALFGRQRQVRARRLNARSGPSIKADVLTRLNQGDRVVQIHTLGKWSQVYLLHKPQVQQTLWVYEPYLEDIPEPPAQTPGLAAVPVESGAVAPELAPAEESPDTGAPTPPEKAPVTLPPGAAEEQSE